MKLKGARRVSSQMLVLDSIEQVGVSSLIIVNSLPSQGRKMGRESTKQINSKPTNGINGISGS